MSHAFLKQSNKLIRTYDSEILWIEAWGENSLRVRSTHEGAMPDNDWALLPSPQTKAVIQITEKEASITNGGIRAEINLMGDLTFFNAKNEILLREFTSRESWGIKKRGRDFQAIPGGDYRLTARFESDPEERIFGMGQYQQPQLNVKGCSLELAHRNSQASIPFAVSSLGYGFLWNNPAIGNVVFGRNITEWSAQSTKIMDYWITAGDTPAQIVETYADVSGKSPMMPEFAAGFWQCKLRYRTQEELLTVAREYKKRGLPINVIVIDFFHWPHQGDWRFDEEYWPDPKAMVAELKSLGIELMVSVWPTVDRESENYEQMFSQGLLMRTNRGIRTTMQFVNDTLFFDATRKEARDFVWKTIRKNYFDYGIKVFCLDEAEPEFHAYDFDNYRYQRGSALEIGNIYPVEYARTFYEGMRANGVDQPINLIRSAWAGSQRFGALLWSGDVASTFASFRNQVQIGMNVGLAGLPWWNSDIGGFGGGNPTDPKFRELVCRWFQFGTFCPVMRLHGDRVPWIAATGTKGGGRFGSGSDNEVWSFGDEAYEILQKYLRLREKMKSYILVQMQAAHEKGTPVMRPIFYDFPQDPKAWTIEDQYLFGPDILVAPVLFEESASRAVYLPTGASWKEMETGKIFAGGETIVARTPLSVIPIFLRVGSRIEQDDWS